MGLYGLYLPLLEIHSLNWLKLKMHLNMPTIGFLCFIMSCSATANEQLFELSLAELTQIKVQISSKREQSIENAAGIVTVVTAEEINRYGARNLHDIMRLVPSVQQVYPLFTHRNSVAIRGQAAGALDKYFLILLNGQPLRDPMLNGINATVYEGIPVELIDRIEIIRGPGSVMYGSNAVSGVMDIITKKASDDAGGTVNVRAGSFSTKINEAVLSSKFGEEGSIVAAIRSHDTKGWEAELTDTAGNEGSLYNKNHAWGAFLGLTYGGFSANLFKADVRELALLSNGLLSSAQYRPSDRQFYSVQYETKLDEHWQLQADFTMNTADVAGSTEYDAKDTVIEAEAHGKFSNMDIDAGINFHRNRLVDTLGNEASDVNYRSVMWQVSIPLSDSVKQAQAMQGVERVTQTLDRDTLWQAQTPQMFRLGALARAYDQVGEGATDEASAMEATGAQPRLVPAQGLNLKLTYPQDLAWAQAWLSQPPHEGRS